MTHNQMAAAIVISSNTIFSGKDEKPFAGYIAIENNKIVAVGNKADQNLWIGPKTEVYELGDQLVMPGIHDNHVFFTGYMSMNRGVDLSHVSSVDEAVNLLIKQSKSLGPFENLYGFGWDKEGLGCIPEQSPLDEVFPDRPVIVINRTKSWCWMNQKAIDQYHFTPDKCSAEDRAALLKDMLQDRDKVKKEFTRFCKLLAARGVTSIKDIGFDEYPLLPVLTELEEEDKLPLRVHFALEPVLEPINIEIGQIYQKRYHGDHLHFQGYKVMVDGVVGDHTGDMLEPYADLQGVRNLRKVDYQRIEDWVLKADRHGFKCCLTAEGDAAIRQAVSILEKCREVNGQRDSRHSISDLEYPHPDDLKRMGENGIFAEVYAQILMLNPSYEESYMADVVGKEKENRFYDYRAMLDTGIIVTAGTDLPLFITNIPESIYAAVKRLFPDGSPVGGWYPERGMPIADLLKAWTINGARHNFMENKTGTIEVGKYADIAVFDRNLFETPASELLSAKVILTIANGDIVHDRTKVESSNFPK